MRLNLFCHHELKYFNIFCSFKCSRQTRLYFARNSNEGEHQRFCAASNKLMQKIIVLLQLLPPGFFEDGVCAKPSALFSYRPF